MKKKILAIILSCLAVGSMCALTACNSSGGDKTEKLAYVSLDINPAIELIVDKDNNVVSVRGENEDGQVLLYEEIGIEGEKVDKAINKITDLAIKYGYLDENNKVVDTIVTSGDDSFANDILSKVNTSITATAENLGLTVTTDGEGAYSLLRKMEEYKAQFPNNKAIQEMSVSKFKLALSVSKTGEISFEAAVELDDAKLVEMLKKASSQIEKFATATYTEAKTKALAVYEQATELAGYAVYTQFYLEKMLTHPLTAYYGGVYHMYASAAKGFDVICDVAEFAQKIENYPLNEEQINAVVTALGMESADALKNSNGEITVESIEAYADKLFKNTPASQTLEQTKVALTEALKSAESVIKEKVGELSAEYRPQIENAMQSAQTILASIENAFAVLPDSIKNVLNSSMADLREILGEMQTMLDDGTIDITELRGFADSMDAKAQEYLDKIDADLSQEEKAELEQRKAAAVSKMTAEKAKFEKALDDAAKAAKEYLQGLKEERIAVNQ